MAVGLYDAVRKARCRRNGRRIGRMMAVMMIADPARNDSSDGGGSDDDDGWCDDAAAAVVEVERPAAAAAAATTAGGMASVSRLCRGEGGRYGWARVECVTQRRCMTDRATGGWVR